MTIRPDRGSPQRSAPPAYEPPAPRRRPGRQRESIGEAMAKSLIRSIAGRLGRAIARMLVGRGR
jgi:hypothetical protein